VEHDPGGEVFSDLFDRASNVPRNCQEIGTPISGERERDSRTPVHTGDRPRWNPFYPRSSEISEKQPPRPALHVSAWRPERKGKELGELPKCGTAEHDLAFAITEEPIRPLTTTVSQRFQDDGAGQLSIHRQGSRIEGTDELGLLRVVQGCRPDP